jgi:DNA-binding IclR family transcriptional regulator
MKLTPRIEEILPRVIELARTMTAADIAQHVGTSPSTVRRILGSLPQLIAQLPEVA